MGEALERWRVFCGRVAHLRRPGADYSLCLVWLFPSRDERLADDDGRKTCPKCAARAEVDRG